MTKIQFFYGLKYRRKSFWDYAYRYLKNDNAKQLTDKQNCFSQITTCKRLFGDLTFRSINETNLKKLNEKLVATGYSDNYVKHIFCTLKVVIDLAVKEGMLLKNPLRNLPLLKGAKGKEIRGLSSNSIKTLEWAKYRHPSLKFVATLFSFQCRTGLSYIDLINLKYSKVQKIENRYWLIGERNKTRNKYTIPLDKVCLEIIDEFKTGIENLVFKKPSGEHIFPFIRRGTYNACLKKVGRITKIEEAKTLSSHKARYTFAERMLECGVSVESIRKMLGHSPKSLATWLYAKVTFQKIIFELPKNY
jgi:integrase